MKKAVFLDTSTLGDDVDLSPLTGDGNDWALHATSDPAEVASRISDADIVVSNKAVVSRDAITAANRLKYICVPATGTNNIDLSAAADKGVTVSNCTAYGTASVSQHVFALMLALATRLQQYSRDALNGQWAQSPMFCLLDYPVMELAGKKLGIIGYGELGQSVARLAEAFGMEVLIANRPGATTRADDRLYLSELLPEADVISLHCPLTDDTRNLIGMEAFRRMKKSALLINCARGGIVDEPALVEALRTGEIAGAGIDVLTEEPPVNGNVLLDPSIPNLIVTPHSAWASREARQRLVHMTRDNIDAYFAGTPKNVVKPY